VSILAQTDKQFQLASLRESFSKKRTSAGEKGVLPQTLWYGALRNYETNAATDSFMSGLFNRTTEEKRGAQTAGGLMSSGSYHIPRSSRPKFGRMQMPRDSSKKCLAVVRPAWGDDNSSFAALRSFESQRPQT